MTGCPCGARHRNGQHLAGCYADASRAPYIPAVAPVSATEERPDCAEPEPPQETPEQRARRLDRERDEAASAYRAAIHAADQAWRAIGGRP